MPIGALAPGAEFLIELTEKDGSFAIAINRRPVHNYRKRIVTPGHSRKVGVSKAERGDVQLSLVQLDVIHGGGGAGGMMPSAPYSPAFTGAGAAPGMPGYNHGGFQGTMPGMPGSGGSLLLDQNPTMPYSRMFTLPGQVGYSATIRGIVSHSPDEFAVDIRENGIVLVHVNPRWPENRICLNHCGQQGWGSEESAALNLQPGTPFSFEIRDQGPSFQIMVNGQPIHNFNKRVHPVGSTREIAIHKVNRQDINVQSVQVDVIGGGGGAGMMPPGGPGFQPFAMGGNWGHH